MKPLFETERANSNLPFNFHNGRHYTSSYQFDSFRMQLDRLG